MKQPICKSILPIVSASTFLAANCAAATIYVDDSAISGGDNGTSWQHAYIDLHDALKAAQSGDEVRIGQGTYKPAGPGGDRTVSFSIPDGVVMQGGYAGIDAANPDANDPAAFITILSGDLNGDDGAPGTFANYGENSHHVVLIGGAGTGLELRGVMVTAGSANVVTSCHATGEADRGGGVWVVQFDANPLIENCILTLNQAWCIGGGMVGGSATVRHCVFQQNRMSDAQSGVGAGAGIAGFGSATVENCDFINNGPANNGGAGGAAIFRNCMFRENHAHDGGGAIDGNSPAVDCVFIGNSAFFGGAIRAPGTLVNCTFLDNSGVHGGAVHAAFSDPTMVNCVFSGNQGALSAGAVYGSATLINCAVVGNVSDPNGFNTAALEGNVSASFILRNTILWGNIGNAGSDQAAQIDPSAVDEVNHSIIQGWDGTLGGTNNSGDDPQFVDSDGSDNEYGTEDDDLRLSEKSPAIDVGENAYLPNDELDLDDDGDTTETIPLDLDLEGRIVNSIVDLGPFEFDGEPVGCDADIAPDGGDSTVNVDDLLVVINNWGNAGPNGDINNDQTVDVADLLAVINTWGDCP